MWRANCQNMPVTWPNRLISLCHGTTFEDKNSQELWHVGGTIPAMCGATLDPTGTADGVNHG